MNKPMYKILFDAGKPYEHNAYNDEDLKEQLKEFYILHNDKSEYFDAKVFNSDNSDISETMFISEIINDILYEQNKTEMNKFLTDINKNVEVIKWEK